jgi:O-antigen/teichoic acid export membrane protein
MGTACILFLFYIKTQYHLPFLANVTSLKRHFPEILHLGKWVSISAAGIMVMFSMDSVMLTYYKDLYSVGLYNAAIPIMQVVLSFMLIFPQVLAPIATELLHHNQIRQLHKLLLTVTISVFMLTGIGLAILWSLRQNIILFLFSDAYSKAATVSLILIAGIPFFTASQMHLTILNNMNRQKTGAILVLCALLLNIFLNAILIPKYDITGAGVATLLSYVSLLIANVTVLWTSDTFHPIQRDNQSG